MKNGKKCASRCDMCSYYDFNEETECYECEVNLDEDEMAKFLSYSDFDCPYYNPYDEYKVVNKQI